MVQDRLTGFAIISIDYEVGRQVSCDDVIDDVEVHRWDVKIFCFLSVLFICLYL